MNTGSNENGFALLTVLWVLIILSAVAVSLTASARLEAQTALAERDAIVADRLALAGIEMADFLGTRRLGTPAENIDGLPIVVVAPGIQYRIDFPEGSVDLFLESDNGRIDPSRASPQILARFFGSWTGDPQKGSRIAQAIVDWRDANDQAQLEGAEGFFYAPLGYAPRNGGLGVGDLPLIRWIETQDFLPTVIESPSGPHIRESLSSHLANTPLQGGGINPDFASRWVLAALPGLTPDDADGIVAERARGFFADATDLATRVGLPPGFEGTSLLRFDRGNSPAVLAVGKPTGSRVLRSLSHAYRIDVVVNPGTLSPELRSLLTTIETDVFPQFAKARATPAPTPEGDHRRGSSESVLYRHQRRASRSDTRLNAAQTPLSN